MTACCVQAEPVSDSCYELPHVVGVPSPRKPIGSFLHRLQSPGKVASPMRLESPFKQAPPIQQATPTKSTPIMSLFATPAQPPPSQQTTPQLATPSQQATPTTQLATPTTQLATLTQQQLASEDSTVVRAASARRLRSSAVDDLDTQDFIPITTSCKKRSVLTEHQREVRNRKR